MNVTFTYAEGALSGPWFRAYRAVKRKLRRGGVGVRVQLLPLTGLEIHIDVLVLPPSLVDQIPKSVTFGEAVTAPADRVMNELDTLVERLLADDDLRVGAPSRMYAIHQGFRPVGQRGRIED